MAELSERHETTVFLRWIKPNMGCFKLNVDGAKDRSNKIGAGGVLRDHNGSWINGFTTSLDCGTVIQAGKLKPILGLKMTKESNCQHLLVECDSTV